MTHNFARTLILAAGIAAIVTLPASAVSLDSLLGGAENSANSLTVGDVNFYDFGFSAVCSGGTGVNFSASCAALVTDGLITGITSEADPTPLQIVATTVNGLDGFTIQGNLGAFSDGTSATVLDITLTYDAAIVGSSNKITDVHLGATSSMNPSCSVGQTCPPVPSLDIEETVNDSNGNFLNLLQVTDPPPSLSDAITISPVSGIEVTKDIDLNSGAGSNGGTVDFAKTTTITQQLSQVPEPRAYAAVLGLFFAAFFVIKRRQTA